MSLENALEKLADAVLAHAEAIRSLAGGAKTEIVNKPAGETGAKVEGGSTVEDPKRKVCWANTDDTYGTCTIAEYRKMSKGDDSYSLITPEEFKTRTLAAKKKEAENAAAAKKARDAKDKKAAADAADAADGDDGDDGDEITDEELGALVKPFAGIETPKERTRRVDWLRTVFARLGVKKASDLDQSQRPEFVKLMQAAVEAVEDDEGADLPDLDDDSDGLV